MTDIPVTKYIIINEKGAFIGSEPTWHHNGYLILNIDKAKRDFANIKKVYPHVKELHVGTFETKGDYAQPGKPSEKNGTNSWCRAKFCNGDVSNWVAVNEFPSDFVCSRYFVQDCTDAIWADADLQSAILKQYEPVNAIKIGKYRFLLEKLIQNIR